MDVWYSTSRRAKAVSLLALTLALWLAGTVFLVAASGEDAYEELWTALAGAGVDWQFAGAHRRSGAERIVAALIAVGGTLMNALGVGVVSDMIATHMDQLRKGRSDVLERDPQDLAAIAGEGEALAEKGAMEKAQRNLAQLENLCGKDCAESRELAAAIARGAIPQMVSADALKPKDAESAN